MLSILVNLVHCAHSARETTTGDPDFPYFIASVLCRLTRNAECFAV